MLHPGNCGRGPGRPVEGIRAVAFGRGFPAPSAAHSRRAPPSRRKPRQPPPPSLWASSPSAYACGLRPRAVFLVRRSSVLLTNQSEAPIYIERGSRRAADTSHPRAQARRWRAMLLPMTARGYIMHSVVLVDRSVSAAASRLNPTSTTYLHIVHSVSAPPAAGLRPASRPFRSWSVRGPFVVRSWSGRGPVPARS